MGVSIPRARGPFERAEEDFRLPGREAAMSRQYRFLQYIVNPFTRHRVTVAALIRGSQAVKGIMAPSDRVRGELGDLRAWNLLASLRRDIEALGSFERLPRSFGPQFVLTAPEPIPSGDPESWVQIRLAAP